MNILLPYTKLDPEVLGRLDGHDVTSVYVGDRDDAYFSLLQRYWGKTDLLIIEHDIGVKPGTVDWMEACPERWCACPYPYLRGTYAGLGCARFSFALQGAHPDIFDVIGTHVSSDHPAKHWCALDQRLNNELRRRGEKMHQHELVEHFGDNMPAHGCWRR